MAIPTVPARRILVVDDEPLVCDSVRMMLEFDGHVVETANSGEEALSLLEKHKFDVIVTDYDMPGMKGDQLAAAIKARVPDQPIIMITVYAETLESGGKSLPGVNAVLSKPFQLDDLHKAVAKVLPKS